MFDARKSPPKANYNRTKNKKILEVSELYYVSICFNLPILEPRYSTLDKTTAEEDLETLAGGGSLRSKCNYTQSDYNFIISKYKLKKRDKNNNMVSISSYIDFAKLMLKSKKDVFLLLTPAQNKALIAAKKGYKVIAK